VFGVPLAELCFRLNHAHLPAFFCAGIYYLIREALSSETLLKDMETAQKDPFFVELVTKIDREQFTSYESAAPGMVLRILVYFIEQLPVPLISEPAWISLLGITPYLAQPKRAVPLLDAAIQSSLPPVNRRFLREIALLFSFLHHNQALNGCTTERLLAIFGPLLVVEPIDLDRSSSSSRTSGNSNSNSSSTNTTNTSTSASAFAGAHSRSVESVSSTPRIISTPRLRGGSELEAIPFHREEREAVLMTLMRYGPTIFKLHKAVGALKMRICGIDSWVLSLAAASSASSQSDAVWCGTRDARLARLDAKTLHFSSHTDRITPNLLTSGVRSLLTTANAIWCGTSHEVVAFDLQTGAMVHHSPRTPSFSLVRANAQIWCGGDKGIHVFDPYTLDKIRYIEMETPTLCMVYDPQHNLIWCGGRENLSVLSRISGERIGSHLLHQQSVTSLARSENAIWSVQGDTVCAWDRATRTLLRSVPFARPLLQVACTSRSRCVWVISSTELMQLDAVDYTVKTHSCPHTSGLECVLVSQLGTKIQVFVGSKDGSISVWNGGRIQHTDDVNQESLSLTRTSLPTLSSPPETTSTAATSTSTATTSSSTETTLLTVPSHVRTQRRRSSDARELIIWGTHSDVVRALRTRDAIGNADLTSTYQGKLRGQPVSVKKLNVEGLSTETLASIQQYLLSIWNVSHPGILLCVGSSFIGEHLYIVTERVERNLIQTLNENSSSVSIRLQQLGRVAEAVNYLHTSCKDPIAHGCLRSSNVWLTSGGNVKVGFGIAHLLPEPTATPDSPPIHPLWRAPELWGTTSATPAGDVFSFGVLLFKYMVETKTLPTYSAHPLLLSLHTDDPDLASATVQAIERLLMSVLGDRVFSPQNQPTLVSLIAACLNLDPAQRPTMPQVMQQLEQALCEFVFFSSEHTDQCVRDMRHASELWSRHSGARAVMVWDRFYAMLREHLCGAGEGEREREGKAERATAEISSLDVLLLQRLLTEGDELSVSAEAFAEFVLYFGLDQRCVQRATTLLRESWFFGHLTTAECVHILRRSPPESYLVRFSSERGCMTFSFITEKHGIRHTRIHASAGSPVHLSDRSFPTLIECVRWLAVQLKLGQPCSGSPFQKLVSKSFKAGYEVVTFDDTDSPKRTNLLTRILGK